jgi:hypothetical protein
MYLVVNAEGKYWDGFAWAQKGKEFLSPGAAHRSLHEEGEDVENVTFVETLEVA